MPAIDDLSEWALLIGVPLIVLFFGAFLATAYSNVRLFISDVTKVLGFLGKSIRKVSIASELEARLNGIAKVINSETNDVVMPSCSVKWVTATNAESVLDGNKVVVRMSFGHDRAENMFNAALAYVTTGLLPVAKPYIGRRTSRALDLVVTRGIIRDSQRDALRAFNHRFEQEPDECRQVFFKLEEIEDGGLLRRVLIEELRDLGETLTTKAPTPAHENEVQSFVEWLYKLATRKEMEDTRLAYSSPNIRVGVILVANEATFGTYGLTPYVRRANNYAADEFRTIYLMSRGRRRGAITQRLAEELSREGFFEQLTKKPTFTVLQPDGERDLITLIAMRPNVALAQQFAWERLREDHAQRRIVSGYIHSVSNDHLVVDVYGLRATVTSAELTRLGIRDVRSYFIANENIEVRIVECEPERGRLLLTCVNTDSDPQKLVELLKAEEGRAQVATVLGHTQGSDGVEIGVILSLPALPKRGYMARRACTFSRFVVLSERFPVGSSISVNVRAFSPEHASYSCVATDLRDPWEDIARYSVGSNLPVVVREITERSLLCEIEDGVEGIVGLSELSWELDRSPTVRIRQFTVGAKLVARILAIELQRYRLILSLKRVSATAVEKFCIESMGRDFEATVLDVGRFSASVRVAGQAFRANLPISELGWTYVGSLEEVVAKGDSLRVRLVGYDDRNDAVVVSAKALIPNQFEHARQSIAIGDEVRATIARIHPDHIEVVATLPDTTVTAAYIRKSQISRLLFVNDVRDLSFFAIGKELPAVVTRLHAPRRLLELSRIPVLEKGWEGLRYGETYSGIVLSSDHKRIFYAERMEARFTEHVQRAGAVEVVVARQGNRPQDAEVVLQ